MKGKGHTARNISLRDRVIEKLEIDGSIFLEKHGLVFPNKHDMNRPVGRPVRDLLYNTPGILEELAKHFCIADEIKKEDEDRKNDPQVNGPLAFAQSGSDFHCPYCNTGHDLEWNTEYGDALDGDYVIQCINEEGCNRTFKISVDASPRYSVG